jgi:hypothetical protein
MKLLVVALILAAGLFLCLHPSAHKKNVPVQSPRPLSKETQSALEDEFFSRQISGWIPMPP